MAVTVLYNQSLFDLSVQLYGTVEAIFILAQANGLSITDTLEVGQELEVPISEIEDVTVKNFYKRNEILPATATPDIEGQAEQPKGIGVMVVGNTLIPAENV